MSKRMAAAALAGLLALTRLAAGGDWYNWRGPARNGVSEEKGLVSTWSKTGENLVWRRVEDFTGRSTPVVFDGRVCASGRAGTGLLRQEIVACCDAGTGKQLWERRFPVYNTTVPFSRVGWASARRRPRDRLRVRAERGRTARRASTARARRSGSAGSARRSAAAPASAAAPSIPLVDEDRLIVGRRGRGLGRHRARRGSATWRSTSAPGRVRWVVDAGRPGPFDDANNQASPTVGRDRRAAAR